MEIVGFVGDWFVVLHFYTLFLHFLAIPDPKPNPNRTLLVGEGEVAVGHWELLIESLRYRQKC